MTGGAGYIGSHAVLALLDAGWPVVVIDDLSTGFDWAVPRAPFVGGDIADQALVGRLIAEHRIARDHAFRRLDRGPGIGREPAQILSQQHGEEPRADRSAVKGGVRHFIFSSTAATYGIPAEVPVARGRADRADQSLWLVQADDRADARRRRRRPSAQLLRAALLQRRRRRSRRPLGQSTAGATHLIKVAVEAATGKRGHVAVYGTDYDTPDGTGVRDYIHVSDLAAAHVDALEAADRRADESHILNCGYGRGFSVLEVLDAVDRVTNADDRAAARAAPRRRSAGPRRRQRRILATLPWRPPARRSRHHRRRRPRLGTQARRARLTLRRSWDAPEKNGPVPAGTAFARRRRKSNAIVQSCAAAYSRIAA